MDLFYWLWTFWCIWYLGEYTFRSYTFTWAKYSEYWFALWKKHSIWCHL